ncbi:heterokaryon incompatibility protein Het-C-domain-containing protein [Cytidiella melzeri]|nr:heterokaryon incompatibility protein Het-C-domain-containing protein [Cytidiella melzeri]
MFNLSLTTFLVLLVAFAHFTTGTYAFGAGEIPEFAYLHAKAFRHGDIENVLEELAKTVGAAAGGASLMGFAQALFNAGSGGGNKFSSSDVKRVYFGNWLRDYSQAMDIAGLSKLTGDTIILIVSILGFVTFGFATEEYEVTKDRLGVYLPVEHIDNPKGYAQVEGDARQYDPRLRPPVNPEELEIDRRTGMKMYMATENRGWDTSTAHIRRVFRECIAKGRRAQGKDGQDLFEAYRLLGTGLHTMEDLLAHSNWCELALHRMGYKQVFPHVGENVIINTPNGPAPPLVTGTFGGADFLHSLMGEATDHLSQASVVDLSKNLLSANPNTDSSLIRSILSKLPIGGSDNNKMDVGDVMQEKSRAYHFDPNDVMPPHVQQDMLALLKWRDSIYRDILEKIEMIPGLESLLNAFVDALNAFVYTILAPYLTPILQQVTAVLSESSKALLDSHSDQYEVFDNPDASDPSHSLLSKDHFALILNEPAGKTALVVVKHAVGLIVNAWFEPGENPDRVIDQILEAFHHPYYNVGRSRIQQEMFNEFERWFQGLDQEEAARTLQALTKESIRNGTNKRQGSDDDMSSSAQVYGQPAHSQSQQTGYSSTGGGRLHTDETYSDAVRGTSHQADTYSRPNRTETYGHGQSEDVYGGGRQMSSDYGHTGSASYASSMVQQSTYGEEQASYGRQTRTEEPYGSYQGGYVGKRLDEDPSSRYGQSSYGEEHHSGGRGHHGRHSRRLEQESSYGRTSQVTSSYAPSYESRQQESNASRYGEPESYGRLGRIEETSIGGYGRSGRDEYGRGESAYESRESASYGQGGSYGQPVGYEQPRDDSYGRRGGDDEGERHHARRYHHQEPERYEDRGRGVYGGDESGGYGGGSDDTFGAERLNIQDEGEERRPHHGHHKKHEHREW